MNFAVPVFASEGANKTAGLISGGLAAIGVPIAGFMEHIPEQSVTTAIVGALALLAGRFWIAKPKITEADAAARKSDAAVERERTDAAFERVTKQHEEMKNFYVQVITDLKARVEASEKIAMEERLRAHDAANEGQRLLFYAQVVEQMLRDAGGRPPGFRIKTVEELSRPHDEKIVAALAERTLSTTPAPVIAVEVEP